MARYDAEQRENTVQIECRRVLRPFPNTPRTNKPWAGVMGHRLGVLLDPRFWLRTYPICHAWSDALEIILDAAEMGDIAITQGKYVAKIGGQHIWVGGFAHAYGSQKPGAG